MYRSKLIPPTEEEESALRAELVKFIVHRSWECTNGVLSEALVADAIEMAAKYCDIHLVRRRPSRDVQPPTSIPTSVTM